MLRLILDVVDVRLRVRDPEAELLLLRHQLRVVRRQVKRLVTIEPSDQDWYANLLWLDGRKCLLLAHAGTLFSVFVPDIRKADMVSIGESLVGFIQTELGAESLQLNRYGVLDSRNLVLAKTEVAPFWLHERDGTLLRIRDRRRRRDSPMQRPKVES